MTVYLSRDYVQSPSGILVQQAGTPYHSMSFYQIAVYLYRILGWSIVGKSGIDLDTTNRSISISSIGTGIPFTITTGVPHGLPIGSSHGAQTTGATGGNGIWHVVATGTNTVEGRSYNGGAGTGGNLVTGPLHASGAVVDGYGAGINFGAGAFFEVSIPVAVRTVVVGDVGRMLVLKSTKFPTKNSGLFKISGINAGSNRYIIDYRATENPPVEAANSIDWWLYEAENVMANQLFVDSFWWHFGSGNVSAATNTTPIAVTASNGNGSHNLFTGQRVVIENGLGNTAVNGTWTITVTSPTTFTLDGSAGNGSYVVSSGRFYKIGYPGNGLSGNPRIIFQSPHSTGYQVRLCLEPRNARLNPVSITTGFNGDGYGDFPVGSAQTHIAEFFNINPFVSQEYTGTVPGYGDVTIQYRNTFIGDTDGYYLFFWGRPTSGVRSPSITMLGVPENEPVPLAINEERVFVYGSAGSVTSSEQGGGVSPRIGINSGNVGLTMKKGAPKFAALTGWANLDGVNLTTPFFSSNAGDSPFTGTTEVLPMEIWVGTYADVSLGTGAIPPFFFDQSYMGTSPLLRLGRSNFASNTIALTNEEVTSRTITNATNASPIQITTSVTNSLVTGQTVTISGVAGNTAANGTWVITRIDGTNFTLNGSTGNGAYTSGGNVNGSASWIHLTNGTFMMWNGPAGITA